MKKIIAFSLMIFTVFSFAGCGRQTKTAEKQEFVTVTVAVRKGEKTVWEKLAADFHLKNPEINVKFIELGTEFEQYRLLTSALSSGEPAFDVMEIEDVWIEEFAESGYLQPLNDSIEQDDSYIDFTKAAFEKDGVRYGVPFQMDIGMILASKQLNWDGNLDSLKTDNESGKTVSADSAEKNDIISTLMELVEYTGNDIEAALMLYKDIYGKETRGAAALKMFGNGELPLVRAWSSVIPKFRDERHMVSGNFRVYNMPNGKSDRETSVAKIFAMAISSSAENKEASEEFIRYCDTYEFQVKWAEETGTYPVRKKIYDEPSIKSEWNHIMPMKDRIEMVQTRPRILKYTEKTDILQGNIESYLAGELSLDVVSEQLSEFLEKSN